MLIVLLTIHAANVIIVTASALSGKGDVSPLHESNGLFNWNHNYTGTFGFPINLGLILWGSCNTYSRSLTRTHRKPCTQASTNVYTNLLRVRELAVCFYCLFFLASNIYHFSFFSSSHQGVYYRKVPFTLPQLIFFEKPIGQSRSVIHFFSWIWKLFLTCHTCNNLFSQLLSHSSFPFLLISLTPSFSPLLFHSFLRRLQPLNHFLSQLPLALNSLSFSQPLSFPVSLQYLSFSSLPLFLRLSLLFLLSIYLSFPISFFFFHLLFPLATPCSHLMHFLINREIQTSTHACNFSQSVFPANFGEREFIWDLYDSKLLFNAF